MNFEERVYKKLLSIPSGSITTYGQLAREMGLVNGQRLIGRIMSRNPYPGIVPCHRVVCFDGKIGGYSMGGESVKATMLQREGISIKNGKISDFEKYLYKF
ncbi:MAG: MGMT family protein [Candidatus Nitrosoabyssus spongiisocia]|nr:MAG: MGMT family protein [Nitrosopumilaceae archaeon AB1(1)]